MYREFYGLKELPFALTPDPRFIYFTPSHTEVMANLHYGIESGKGLVVVTGEVGTGKTTILRIIAGLEQPDKGGVVLHGKDVTDLPARRPAHGSHFARREGREVVMQHEGLRNFLRLVNRIQPLDVVLRA